MASNESVWKQLSQECNRHMENEKLKRESLLARGRCPHCGSQEIVMEYPPDSIILSDTQGVSSYGEARMKCGRCKRLLPY